MTGSDLHQLHDRVMTDAWKRANVAMRELFMTAEDTTLSAAIAQSRKKGTAFASQLASQWTPIRWMRGRPGFTFEISPNDYMTLGEETAHDMRIDEAVIGAVMDAIDGNLEFIGEVVRDIALGGRSTDIYEVEDRSWNHKMARYLP